MGAPWRGARSQLGPNTIALLIVANLIAYKGHDDLLQALALLRPKMPCDWRLLAVGRDDGIGAALRSEVRGARLAGSH